MSTFSMPAGFPKLSDFSSSDISIHPDSWRFHRNPGTGGRNYGEDHLAPNDTVIVGVDYNVTSEHNTKGGAAFELVTKGNGVLLVPVGFHVGHRLEPDGFGGAGATFQGDIQLKCVSLVVWMSKILATFPHH